MSIIFFDFDGTITKRDTTDAVLEAFAMPPWQDIEEDWVAGRIGSRECMTRQLALVKASESDLNALLDSLEICWNIAKSITSPRISSATVSIISSRVSLIENRSG